MMPDCSRTSRVLVLFIAVLLLVEVKVLGSQADLRFESTAKGHIFAAEQGEVVLHVPPSSQGGSVTISNEQGLVLQTLPIKAGEERKVIPLKGKGFYHLQAKADLGDKVPLERDVTAAVIGPELPEALRRQSRIGLWTVQGDPELARLAGANWNRLMTSLKDYPRSFLEETPLEEGKKKADISMFTNVGVISFGLPLWMFDPVPAGYEKKFAKPFQKPRDWDELSRLVRAFVRKQPKWEGFPPYFELYNEPEWHWKGSEEDLVRFQKTVADAIRKERPEVKVLGPGFSSIRIKDPARLDLETVARLGLLDHLDGLVVHAYVDGSAPEEQFIQRVQELQDFLIKVGKPDFPIHLTEFGWCTRSGTWQRPVSELDQARYTVRSLSLLAAVGVENATYFCLLFKAAPNGGEGSFSILQNDLTPKPAYASFSNTARWLAGVQGKARWLQLTPTTYFLVFRKADHDIGVLWDTKGERTVTFSGLVAKAEDMTGRPIPIRQGKVITISPSPVFLQLSDKGLYTAVAGTPLRVMRGTSARIPGGAGDWLALSPLKLAKGSVMPPADAPEGTYMLLSRAGDAWKTLPVEVVAPIQVSPVQLEWAEKDPVPRFKARLQSHAEVKLTAYPSVKLEGLRTLFGEPVDIKAGTAASFELPMESFELGKRYKGVFAMETREVGKADRVEQELDLTLLSARRCELPGRPDWSKIDPVDFTDWDRFGEVVSPENQSATLQAAYDAEAFYLRVRVRDDQHLQEKDAENLWAQDSIQLGFDVDAQKSWEANDLFGLKGHRVFEYGVAWNGKKAMNWRWISYLPDLPVGQADERIGVQVKRDGDVTQYDMVFPWVVLGTERAPEAGRAIGISLAVTDTDPGKGGRRGLRLFGGITDGKDPEKYGKIWLR